MRKIGLILFLLSPATVFAQQMSQQDMQNMMVQVQEVQACMQSIDQNELNKLQEESKKIEAEVKSLCDNSKRDEAQDKAMAYSKEVINSAAMATMRKCTENLSGALKGMMPDLSPEKIAKDFSDKHVCDEI
jgi:cell division protein FtsB